MCHGVPKTPVSADRPSTLGQLITLKLTEKQKPTRCKDSLPFNWRCLAAPTASIFLYCCFLSRAVVSCQFYKLWLFHTALVVWVNSNFARTLRPTQITKVAFKPHGALSVRILQHKANSQPLSERRPQVNAKFSSCERCLTEGSQITLTQGVSCVSFACVQVIQTLMLKNWHCRLLNPSAFLKRHPITKAKVLMVLILGQTLTQQWLWSWMETWLSSSELSKNNKQNCFQSQKKKQKPATTIYHC